MKKIGKAILFITLVILLAGFANASEVSQDISDADIISEELEVKDTDAVSNDDALADKEAGAVLQKDNEHDEYESAENTLKLNNGSDEYNPSTEVTSWEHFVGVMNFAKYLKGEVTITFLNGTYINTGTVTINNPDAVIIIKGNGQTIDGNGLQVLNIGKSGTVVIENITITNGVSEFGGAIGNYGTLTVTQSTFTQNTGRNGGAIVNFGTLTVMDSTLENNKASNTGGAILNAAETCKIIGSNFTGNRAEEGAAILSLGGGNITGNRFSNNRASVDHETIDLVGHGDKVVDANTYESTDISFKSIKLETEDNKNVYYNGEEVKLNSNMALEHPDYYDKDILEKLKDVALYINGVEDVTGGYSNYTLSNLKPGEYEVYYTTCNKKSNTVKFTVRPITNWQQLIGAVDYAKNQKKDISIVLEEGDFINTGTINWTKRGAVLTIDGNGQTIDGNQKQAFYVGSGASMVLKNVTIQNAKSENGAILNAGTLRVAGALLANNTATYDGGAIANYGTLTVIKSTLENNTAYNNGGAIKNGNLRADIIDSNFTNNHAAAGGAIFSSGKCNITGNIFTGNTADNGQTIDLYSRRNEQLDLNVYESTDIALKTAELRVKDDQSVFIQGDDVVLNFNIALKIPYYYDKDILQRLEDITVYINGEEYVTAGYPNCTLSNLKPGEYTVYYKTCNQKSNSVSFKVIDEKDIDLKTWDIEMVQGKTATFSAVVDYKNTKVNYGKVYFEIDGKPLVRRGAIMYAPVKDNEADLEYPTPIDLPVGNHTITAVYVYGNRILATDTKTLTITEDIPEGSGDDGDKNREKYESSILKYGQFNFNAVSDTYTVTRAGDDQLVCVSDLFILEYLNKLFNMTFINGHMKVYIDGKLVFEGDTTDDLTQVIFDIIDEYLGEHEIAVEFTDSEGKTNNYNEKIIVK